MDGLRWTRSVEATFESFWTPLVLAAGYAVFGIVSIVEATHIHDEGMLTWIFARWTADAPLATLFFQKSKPVLSLVYALPAALGPTAFYVAHVLIAASAIPMISAVARHLGMRLPALAGVVVASSPLFLQAGPAGLSNADGVVAVTLFCYLLVVRKRPVLAGLVLGACIWVRFELAVFVVVLCVFEVAIQKRLRVALAALVFPAAYAVAGMIYHADPAWMSSFPPSLSRPMPGNPFWEGADFGLGDVMLTTLAVTPAVLLATWVSYRRIAPLEKALALCVAIYLLAIFLLPLARIANFDQSPRYAMQALPVLALLANRGADRVWREGAPRTVALAVTTALVLMVAMLSQRLTLILTLAVAAALLAVSRTGYRATTVAVVAGALVVGTVALAPHAELSRATVGRDASQALEWLQHNTGEADRSVVYTDIAVLDSLRRRTDSLRDLDVRYLVREDQHFELVRLTNPNNGQRAELLAEARRIFYGSAVMPDEIRPDLVPADALFVLSTDERTEKLLPADVWSGHLTEISRTEHLVVSKYRPDTE